MMLQKNKSNVIMKALLCIMLACTLFGAIFFMNRENGSTKVSAEVPAGAIEYDEYLGLEDRSSWASGGHADIVTLGLMDFSITEGNQYFKSSVGDCWYHGNSNVITANNGVDILQYVYLNDVSARDLITENAVAGNSTAGTVTWLSNSAAWPIAFETGADCWIRIDKSKFGGNFTFTFKAGFSLIRNDGTVIYLAEDLSYSYQNGVLAAIPKPVKATLSFEGLTDTIAVKGNEVIGELPAVPAREGYVGFWTIDNAPITAKTVWTYAEDKTAMPKYALEYDDFLGIEDRTSWASGGHADIVTFGLTDFSITEGNQYFKSSVNGCWYHGNNNVITANNGVDILQYVYLNDVSARDLLTANATAGNSTANTGCWLSNPAAWPIAFETGADCWIRIDKTKFGGDFTFTIKEGFSLLRNDGEVIYVSHDITYTYANGVLGARDVDKFYTLAFDGTEVTKQLKSGAVIGEIPEIPVLEGKLGVWQIDGVEIDAETAYNFGANKTATLVYYEGTDLIDSLDMLNWGSALGADCTYIRVGNTTDENGNLIISTAFNNIHWQDHASLASENYACDIMEYIYINGKSAREISTENGINNTYGGAEGATFPFANGGVYAPIDVFTSGNDFFILIMTDYVAAADLEITFKAGFRLANAEGGMWYLSKDFVFPYYTVTFDGVAKKVNPNTAVEAPVEPTKDETESHTYAFDGWYYGETKWNFEDPVTQSIELVARFIETEKEKFAVTFCGDNGTENVSVDVYVNACIKEDQIPENPVKESEGDTAYNFIYWSLDGENAYDFSTPVTEAITLTAVYTTKPLYAVTMGEVTVNVIEGDKVVRPEDPTKEATAEFEYIFEGWYLGEEAWDFENNTVTSDIELIAKYTEVKRTYTVSFNVTGREDVTLEAVEVEYGTTYDLSTLLDGVDVADYTYTITVDGEEVTSVEVVANVTVDVAFVARVYYTVTIDGVEQTVEEGSLLAMPETEPTKESTKEFDYIFDGWYNGETKWDFENDTVTSDLELVAKYTEAKRKYTVSFTVTGNDDIKLDSVEVEYGEVYDLTKLLDGKDVSGYRYSISVNGVEKSSVKVIGDTEVTVEFTKIAGGDTDNDNETDKDSETDSEANTDSESGKTNPLMGCMGSIGSATGVMISVLALGVAKVMKKKEKED